VTTDRRDALQLACLLRSGDLSSVYAPTLQDESVTDLCRLREDLLGDLNSAKLCVKSFLLRHDIRYEGEADWTAASPRTLANLALPNAEQKIVFLEYLDGAAGGRGGATSPKCAMLAAGPVGPGPAGIAWRAVPRGSDCSGGVGRHHPIRETAPADGVCRTASQRVLQRRHSTSGGIAKTGNAHARRVLVEGAWSYRHPACVSPQIRLRQEALPGEIRDIAWKAQLRLCARSRRMLARGKNRNLVITAIARELIAFMWAIAKKAPLVEAQPLAQAI
jgi:transposase